MAYMAFLPSDLRPDRLRVFSAPLGRLLLVTFFLLSSAGSAATFYVRPGGSDRATGTSMQHAWQTINKVNTAGLQPGDTVLFEGGATFTGSLYFAAGSGGTAEAPITLGSYGNSRATIHGGGGSAFYAHNAAGIRLRDLNFTGSGMTANTAAGVMFFNDLAGNVKLPFIRLENISVTGFGKEGIVIGSWKGTSGYRDLRITGIDVHRNGKDGMITYSQSLYGLEDVYIAESRFYDNPGMAGHADPTGSGLVLGGVNGAVVERSAAWGNGSSNTNAAGPVGIWAWNSTGVVIQFCESFNNRSQGGDGGGFDLDGGVTDSILQFNYSHGNDGAGFGLFQYAGAPASGNNTIRYNVSQNDGRRHLAGISIWGASSTDRVGESRIYHNVVYMDHAAGSRPALQMFGGHYSHIGVHNNVFITTGGSPLIDVDAAPGHVSLQGNSYWSSGAPFLFRWNAANHTSLAGWRAATGQEMLDGAPTGLDLNPLLENAGQAKALDGQSIADGLQGYRLRSDSPLIGAGLNLLQLFGIHSGEQDLFGSALDLVSPSDIGVHRPFPSADAPLTFDAWRSEHFSAEQLNDPEIGGPTAIPAGDGMPNLLKYALGADPWSPSREAHPQGSMQTDRLTLTFNRPRNLPDIVYEIEASSDLIEWESIAAELTATPLSDDLEEVRVSDGLTAPSEAKRFLRLVVRQRE